MDRLKLQKAFERVSHAVEAKSPLQAITCARWADGRLVGTNLVMTVDTALDGGALPSMLISPHIMLAKCKAFADCSDVDLRMVGDDLQISSGARRAKVPTQSPASFPDIGESFKAQCHELALPIKQVLPAASRDTTRPHISQVVLDGDTLVALDGHRIHAIKIEGKAKLSIPISVAKSLPDTQAEYLIGESKASCGELTWSQCLESFPPWKQVMPAKSTNPITFARDHALTAIRAVLVADSAGATTAKLSGSKAASQITIETANAQDSWDADVQADFAIGLNGQYIADAISACAEPIVALGLGSALEPIRIDSGAFTAVIMPCRI